MQKVRYNEITTEEEGQRLDNYLVRILKGVPKSHIYRLIRGGEVRVNKKRAQASTRIAAGDRVRIPPLRSAGEAPINIPQSFEQSLQDSLLFEDNRLLVINKPAGIAVHGGSGLSLGIIEALRKLRPDLSYLELVHRLDRETSGCLVLAKKRSCLRAIQALLTQRQVKKTYWALMYNSWHGKKERLIDVPLKKNSLKSGERVVVIDEKGKKSQTLFKLLENFPQACWAEMFPKTGRTHQIRVHSAYMGHPIIGDNKYAKNIQRNELMIPKTRLCLHARAIQFTLDEKTYTFTAELDKRFMEVLNLLGAGSKNEA